MNWTDQVAHAVGVLALLIFAGAGACALFAIIGDLRVNWDRIVEVLSYRSPAPPAPAADDHSSLAPIGARSPSHVQ